MDREQQIKDFKKEVEVLHDITDAEEYARQLALLFLGNGLSLQTILLMAIDFGQQHPQWIPVEERKPDEGQVVLIYSKAGDVCVTCYKNGAFNHSPLFQAINVTHWMEIQPPRKEDKK